MQSKTLDKSVINQLKAEIFPKPSKIIIKNRFKQAQQASCNGVCASGRCRAVNQ